MTLPNHFTVVLDTCVLAPMPLADTLLRLAEEPEFYIPKWSAHSMVELRRVLISRWRHDAERADRRIQAMTSAFPDATVRGNPDLEAAVTNALEDRHVLAAAIASGAMAIVTANTKDFPLESLAPYDIELMTPDAFLLHQLQLSPQRFRARLAAQANDVGARWDDLLIRLERHAPTCVDLLRQDLP